MENRKGSGIFLGVVSVATLIVAIIGATFAYFSSTAQSGEEAVGATAYEFDVTVTEVKMINPSEMTGIIPLQAEKAITPTDGEQTTNLLYALNKGGKNGPCTDSNGYQVCAIYKVTLNNGGGNDEKLNLEVKTTKNKSSEGKNSTEVTEDDTRTHFTDLTFQALSGAAGTFTKNGALVTLAAAEGTSKEVEGITITATAGTTTEHYFVVYLAENNDSDDQSEQMGADFAGQLVYTTATGGNRLTGTFTFEDPAP